MAPSAWEFHHGAKIVEDPSAIRNVCILAHVDHGKTTLADALVASNGIISARLSGKLRYLDDREDEQRRGITMKSSAITLLHKHRTKLHCVNLVDSPGHVDFSSEVSTAVRLSDGAIIVVDALEGVSAQTHVVLRQAWLENLKPVLVLNKIDRLMLERQLDPTEAYHHLQGILADVNAITSTLFTAELLADEDRAAAAAKAADTAAAPADGGASGGGAASDPADLTDQVFDWAVEDKDDDAIYFEPSRGNVLFGSALDGWGFTVGAFAEVLAKKFKCRAEVLKLVLWGDYYITKEKGQPKVRRGASSKGKTPLFASAVLSTIWDVYRAVCVDKDKAKIDKITASLGVKLSIRDLQSDDRRAALRAVLGQWMPVSRAVMAAVCDVMPPPCPLPEPRVRTLLTAGGELARASADVQSLAAELSSPGPPASPAQGQGAADTSTAAGTTLAFVSKMVAIDRASLPTPKAAVMLTEAERAEKRRALLARRRADGKDGGGGGDHGGVDLDTGGAVTPDTSAKVSAPAADSAPAAADPGEAASTGGEDGSSVMIAYARVFCGRLSRGEQIHVLGAQYDPATPNEHASTATVTKLFVLMGKELVEIESAPAGMVVGILGLGDHIQKSATLTSSLAAPSLTPMHFVGAPIVRVALETKSIADMPALRRGLKLLHQADPGVEVLVQGSGELVLVGAGEVHIERCVLDLRTLFCPGVDFTMSKPIIPLRESITESATVDMTNEKIDDANVQVVARKHFLLDGMPETVDASGAVTIHTADKRWSVTVRARPLPSSVTDYLTEHADRLRACQQQQQQHQNSAHTSADAAPRRDSDVNDASMRVILGELGRLFAAEGPGWAGAETSILAFGPRHCGPNLMLTATESLETMTIHARVNPGERASQDRVPASICAAMVTGFQVITHAGPLADEPLIGVAFDVLRVEAVEEDPETAEVGLGSGKISGQVISATKEVCRWAFLSQTPQLLTAWYACDLMVSSEMLGKVMAVLTRRGAKILAEEMRLGTEIFEVKALVPVTGSFGFATEIRLKSSGHASPQLLFSHWGPIHGDPFWVPSTEEELAHYGEMADAPNPARDLLNDVRKRKGLRVEEKLVEFAEKQRTLGKNK